MPKPITMETLCAGYFQGQKGLCEVGLLWPALLLLIHCGTWESLEPSGPHFPIQYSGGEEAEPPFTGNL